MKPPAAFIQVDVPLFVSTPSLFPLLPRVFGSTSAMPSFPHKKELLAPTRVLIRVPPRLRMHPSLSTPSPSPRSAFLMLFPLDSPRLKNKDVDKFARHFSSSSGPPHLPFPRATLTPSHNAILTAGHSPLPVHDTPDLLRMPRQAFRSPHSCILPFPYNTPGYRYSSTDNTPLQH